MTHTTIKKEEAVNAPQFMVYPEKQIAGNITGEGLILNSDILLYIKFCSYNQKVLDRLSASDETLQDEILKDDGFILFGEPEALRAELHKWVDMYIDGTKSGRSYTSDITETPSPEPTPPSEDEVSPV